MKQLFTQVRWARFGRLAAHTALYAGVMLAGYAGGILLMVWRYDRAERLYELR